MKYPFAERFKAPQGEGLYTGTQMAFARLVGCSVGHAVCHACDTDFDAMRADLGGGLYTPDEVAAWAAGCQHVCLTGGEPLDRDLRELILRLTTSDTTCHVETSGTVWPAWLDADEHTAHGRVREAGVHRITRGEHDAHPGVRVLPLWVCVSPKPGFLEEMVVAVADEVKVILGGLGDGPGWPTLDDALRWRALGLLVYVQPRNARLDIHRANLDAALAVVARHPQLRLSAQLHKFVRTR